MLGSIISKFDAEAKSHLERQSLNPFSGNFSRSPSPRLSKDQYGKPLAGSKTEERGQRAKCHILREIQDLCNCIHDVGTYNKSHRRQNDSDDEEDNDDEIIVTFGEIFQIYTKINDKVVGLLIAAKKRGFIFFEKEILFQRRDDDVLIALIKPIREIRATINKELTANASPVPFASREVSPAVEDAPESSKNKSGEVQAKRASPRKSITPDVEHSVVDENKKVTPNTTSDTTSSKEQIPDSTTICQPPSSMTSSIEAPSSIERSEAAIKEPELLKNEIIENEVLEEIMPNKSDDLSKSQNESSGNDAKPSNEEKATQITMMIPILEITFEPDPEQDNTESVEYPENSSNPESQISDICEQQSININEKDESINATETNINSEENVQKLEKPSEEMHNGEEKLVSKDLTEDIPKGEIADNQDNTIEHTLSGPPVELSSLSEAPMSQSPSSEAHVELSPLSEAPVSQSPSSDAPVEQNSLSEAPEGLSPAPEGGLISSVAPLVFTIVPPETEIHQSGQNPYESIIIKIDDQTSSPSTFNDNEVTNSTRDERLLDELTSSSDRCPSPDLCDAEVEQILQSQINCSSLSTVHSETTDQKIITDQSNEV